MDMKQYIDSLCGDAKAAWPALGASVSKVKDEALLKIAELVEKNSARIEEANRKDLDAGRKAELSSALLDRLELNAKRISAMARGLREVAALADPVGSHFAQRTRPNGLCISKMRVPIGVILMIYESRPNVTVDSAALCLKSGNCAILRGGKEAMHSNMILSALIKEGLAAAGLPRASVQLIETTDRAAIDLILQKEGQIDLVIPRGGEALIRAVAEKSRIPTIKHYKGVCHVFIDREADLRIARAIALNAKIQKPGVCNAMETLLIDAYVPTDFVRELLEEYHRQGVEIRGCSEICRIDPQARLAEDSDWYAEYLDLILSVRVADGLDSAIEHIARYGSAHTDAIVTENKARADEFVRRVDSASVMVNASTRFSDGGEYGLGAEIGISTDKLHARGPMGLEELTTYKWVVLGNGQVRT